MFRFNSDPILLNMTSYIKKESCVMLRDIQGVFYTGPPLKSMENLG